MNYVNVAQNIVAGKGITQPTLGFNEQSFSIEGKPPVAFVAQAPLYPIMIALVSGLQISPARSALLLSAVGQALVIFLAYRLAAALYDKSVGLISVSLLLFYYPMRWIAGWAWTEPIAIAFLLLSLLLLTNEKRERSHWFVFAAGLACGFAFATRYALAPLLIVGILFLLLNSAPWRNRLTQAALYALGFALPAACVVLRNFWLLGRLMPSFNQTRIAFLTNLTTVLETTFGSYLDVVSPSLQIALLVFSFVLICIALLRQHNLFAGLRDAFASNGRYILICWTLAYITFLIGQRCFSYFDVDARTVAPAGVTLLLLWVGALLRAIRIPARYVSALAFILLLVAIGREARATLTTTRLNFQQRIAQSERLSWIDNYTSDKDLIIGDDVVDVPFFLRRGSTLCFSPYPYTDHPSYEKILAYARRHCREYDNIYLILRNISASEDAWRSAYGDFFTDLVFGRTNKYPNIVVLQPLKDGCVFQIVCR